MTPEKRCFSRRQIERKNLQARNFSHIHYDKRSGTGWLAGWPAGWLDIPANLFLLCHAHQLKVGVERERDAADATDHLRSQGRVGQTVHPLSTNGIITRLPSARIDALPFTLPLKANGFEWNYQCTHYFCPLPTPIRSPCRSDFPFLCPS